jgi:predicted AAA+ superfamily ATPase
MAAIPRHLTAAIKRSLSYFPVVCLLGPRQCGKTTLAKEIIAEYSGALYLDLELVSGLKKLEDPEFYLSKYEDVLICLDEIQRMPEIFPLMRALIDQNRKAARFLILGSASQDLIRQSTETLAGRISYHELTPFIHGEIPRDRQTHHWIHGGFPDSYCAPEAFLSVEWKASFINTFLEKDLSNLGFSLSPVLMKRFWTMLAHHHGGLLNRSTLANSLGVSSVTVQSWQDVFEQTFMIRVLKPYATNTKKRLVKTPKVYLRDSGLLHELLNLESFDDVMGHTICGASWEGYAIENIISVMPKWEASFYRTSNGSEIDLILEKNQKRMGIEFKLSLSPSLSKGSKYAMEDLGLEFLHVIIPQGKSEMINPYTQVDTIESFCEKYAEEVSS